MITKKNIIIGIDLSFKCTGITIYNQYKNELTLYRVLDITKLPKIKQIHKYTNVNDIQYYPVAKNFQYGIDSIDYNKFEENQSIKLMMCCKAINNCIVDYLKINDTESIQFVFEMHLMPQLLGKKQFRSLSHLIALQHLLRSNLITYFVNKPITINFQFYSASSIKKIFTGYGKSSKTDMYDTFISDYNGNKLIPNISSIVDKHKIVDDLNDVVDSFALIVCSLSTYYGINESTKITKNKSTIKSRNKKQTKNNITTINNFLMESIIKQ